MRRRVDYIKGETPRDPHAETERYLGERDTAASTQPPRHAAPNRLWRNLAVATVVALGTVLLAGVVFAGVRYVQHAYSAPSITVINPETGLSRTFEYGAQPLLSQKNFFTEVKTALQTNNKSFVEADLSQMRIRFYEDGVLADEWPILSKGREGSWWETPSGLYSIQSKAENHFSSFGSVYMPWSMAFQGNFFIHGWPYYPDGTQVESTYSGGCIRLADEDAKALFGAVSVGTPVLVYEEDYESDGFSYALPAPSVSADHYAVIDVESGTILAEKDMKDVRSVASITKLFTALVAAEHINLDKEVTIQQHMLASTSIPRLEVGESLSAYSLLLPLLRESSNEAAEALAAQVGRQRFIALMNEKAAALGMENTRFTDPSGAEHGNVSSVSDLLRLAQYLYNNRSFILRISSGADVPTAYRTADFVGLQNFNEVPGIGGLVGGKVGKNSIGETALLLFSVSVKNEDRVLAVVVLDSDDRIADVRALLWHVADAYDIRLSPL